MRARRIAARGLLLAAAALPGAAHAALESRWLGTWTLGGYAETYAVFETDRATQSQNPAGIAALKLDGELHPNARFHLETRVQFGGFPENADGFGVVNLADVFQNQQPRLEFEEGYLDLSLGSVDLRLGKQKFAWGKLDSSQPTDVLNPQRYNDPFVDEEQDAKIGIPALQASVYLSTLDVEPLRDTSATLVWIPVPVPFRFPLQDERWFPQSTEVPSSFVVGADAVVPGQPEIDVPVNFRTQNHPPAQQLDEGGVALRFAGFNRGIDWSVMYYDGPETAIGLDLDVFAFSPATQRKLAAGKMPTPQDLLDIDSDAFLRPRYSRIRVAGGDAAFEYEGFTARVEGAYGTDRLLPRTTEELLTAQNFARATGPGTAAAIAAGKRARIDLGDLTVQRDVGAWGLGIDYLWEGWTPLVQVNQTLVRDNSTELLVNDVDTTLLFVVRKAFFAETLATESAVLQGLARGYTMGRIKATYAVTDDLRVRLGYLLIAGSRRSLIGQFAADDEGFLQIRYSF